MRVLFWLTIIAIVWLVVTLWVDATDKDQR